MGQNPSSQEQRERFCRVGAADAQTQTTGHDVREWVIPTGGGYFFAPSVFALKFVLSK